MSVSIRNGGIMNTIKIIHVAALLLMIAIPPALAERKGELTNTVGVMTQPVIEARLKQMGYSNVRVSRPSTLRYKIDAVKNGKPVVLELHPQTGEVRELAGAGLPARRWRMPLEPIRPMQAPTSPTR
jgi:hypothetical protein